MHLSILYNWPLDWDLSPAGGFYTTIPSKLRIPIVIYWNIYCSVFFNLELQWNYFCIDLFASKLQHIIESSEKCFKAPQPVPMSPWGLCEFSVKWTHLTLHEAYQWGEEQVICKEKLSVTTYGLIEDSLMSFWGTSRTAFKNCCSSLTSNIESKLFICTRAHSAKI